MVSDKTAGSNDATKHDGRSNFTPRVIAVILIILVLFLGWTFFWLLYAERQALIEARRDSITSQVQLAVSLCRSYASRAESGDLTRDGAMDLALAQLRTLRYGSQSAGHFYIITTTGKLVSHPLRADMEGMDVVELRDGSGNSFIKNIIYATQHEQYHQSEYYWRWLDGTHSVPMQLACAGRYEPWNWIIITDIATTDIDEQVAAQLMRQVWILLFLIIVLAGVLSATLKRLVLSGVDRLTIVAKKLAKGDLAARVTISQMDELNYLAVSFNKMAEGIEARNEQIQLTQRAAVFALAKLSEARDNETGGHLLRVREYATLLAHALRKHPKWEDIIDNQFLEDIFDASLLHDIGKVAIPDKILLKPDVLDEGERAIMMSHTLIGANTIYAARVRMKAESSFLKMAEDIARCHHERWDGKGYVESLAGTAIPPAARIFTVADIYDALTTERPYKKAMSHKETLELMIEDNGTRFDPDVFNVFMRVAGKFDEIRLTLAD